MNVPERFLIDCVATGRDPTVQELLAVAERIWSETGRARSALSWRYLPTSSEDRARAIQLALAAMRGSAS
jgi:hypothetical protein